MKSAACLVFVLLTIFDLSQAQNFFTVIAKNGVAIRKAPQINSERVGALNFGETVEVLKFVETPANTGEKVTVDAIFKWAEIKLDNKNKGYISEQYLLKNYLNPKDYGYDCKDFGNDSAVVSFKKFKALIYCYRIFERSANDLLRKDSVYLYEETFYETSNKILEIVPKVEVDSVSVFYTAVETIEEQLSRKKKEQARNWSYEKLYKNTVHWKGMEDFVRLEGQSNFFRFPIMQYENLEKFRKKKMTLRDTLVDLSGESSNIATLIYKEKPCRYQIESVILKVVIYPKKAAPETRYVKIILSYGC